MVYMHEYATFLCDLERRHTVLHIRFPATSHKPHYIYEHDAKRDIKCSEVISGRMGLRGEEEERKEKKERITKKKNTQALVHK
jgi:hypothetical protein